MKGILTTGWNFMRILRLLVGIISIYYAFGRVDAILGLAGLLFIVSAVFNVGCFGATGCNVRNSNKKISKGGKQG